MFELRYRVFIQQVGYEVPSFDDMEYDRYDTPATVYFISRDPDRGVTGMVRVAPTDRPYMIEDVWPGLINGPKPKSISIFEGSRFAIDPSLNGAEKQRIKAELVCAFLEFGLLAGVSGYVGVMPLKYWQSVFINSGWPVRFMGDPMTLADGNEILAGEYLVSADILQNVRMKTGITAAVLETPIEKVYKSPTLRMAMFNHKQAVLSPSPGVPEAPKHPALKIG